MKSIRVEGSYNLCNTNGTPLQFVWRLEVCYRARPEFPVLHSRKYKLSLSGQNNKPFNVVQVQDAYWAAIQEGILFKSGLTGEQQLSKILL